MERRDIRLLLEALWDRLERDPTTGKWRLAGLISAKEQEALKAAITELGGAVTDSSAIVDSHADAPTVIAKVKLNLDSLKAKASASEGATFCLDFGTAMSKAFAIGKKDHKPFGLALGERSRASGSVYAVPSSMYFPNDGRIYFGERAISHSLNDDGQGRQRFDSPKQYLSKSSSLDTLENIVGPEINPTKTPFTYAGLITLYLAFLTDLSSTEIAEKHHLSRHLIRRFALPYWEDSHREGAEKKLKQMLAGAQILADTFQGQWHEGLKVETARAALDALREVDLPLNLIAEGVPEPIAAAASRVFEGEAQRQLYLVVDVGAGTTDFGVFLFQENPGKGWTRVRPIAGGLQTERKAGDDVDAILRAELLRRHGGAERMGDPDFKRVIADLDLRKRQIKETMFRQGKVDYRLADDSRGVLTVDEFCALDQVQRLEEHFSRALNEILNRVDKSWLPILRERHLTVVLTGGGASLPMIQSLAKGVSEAHGLKVLRKSASALPAWVREDYPQFSTEYSQLAVAMGGAEPELPETMEPVKEFGGLDVPSIKAGNLRIAGS